YTWDITKLAGPSKGVYYDAYVMIDIYSRYIIGVHVHARESGPLAEEMMREVFGIHGIPQVIHADRGTSMTSKSVATLLADLEVTRSHSRPKVSNDNPYSETWFKTLKYSPDFPERFGSLTAARAFMDEFVAWYNHEHTTRASGSIRRPMSTTDLPLRRPPNVPACSLRRVPLTPSGSAPTTPPRSSPCPRPPGSTNPMRRRRINPT